MAGREGHLRHTGGSPPRRKSASPATRGSERSGLLDLQRLAGNAATRRAVEQPLDPGVRGQLERRFGADLGSVRVRQDAAATARAGGIAYTVGERITVDPTRYRPGTFTGDLLLAHEVAHTMQQRQSGPGSGHSADEHALEADADRAALAAVSEQPSTGLLPSLRSALSLRRCKGCTDEEEQRLNRFRAETDPERLADMLHGATADQLRRLSEAPGGDQLHRDAVAWEQAWRDRRYARLSELSGSTDSRFRTAYGRRLVASILEGGLSIRVTGGDDRFRSFVESALRDLSITPHGLRLLLDLLATGQQVNLAPATAGAGHSTDAANEADARLSTQITDENDPNVGAPLPPGRQRAGRGTGSTVTLDMSTIDNQVVLGGNAAQPTIIDMPASVTVGHELIHALHNARGINIGTGLDRRTSQLADPVTGEQVNPEELHTISGQTTFSPLPGLAPADMSQPTQYNVPPTVTENDLRADLGLAARSSHFGAVATISIPRGASATVDALVARYRLPGGSTPPDGAAVIRTMLAARGLTDQALAQLPADFQLAVPHPDHVLLRIRMVDRNRSLADRMNGLTVR